MAESETQRRAGSGSGKINRQHKYTLDEVLQLKLKFDEESSYWNSSD